MNAPCRRHEWEPNFDATATWFECHRCGTVKDQQERVSGGPTGIIETDFDLNPDQAEHLVAVWRAAGNGLVVFGKGVHYRARLADGSFEPRQTELVTIKASRNWLPYLIALTGWVVAALAVVLR